MASAIEQGIPKLRIEEAAARTQARIDAGKQTRRRREQVPLDRGRGRFPCSRSTTRPCARGRSRSWSACAPAATSSPGAAALDALTRCAETGEGNLLELAVAGGAGTRHGRRDHRGDGEGLGPPCRRDPLDRRRLRPGGGGARERTPRPRAGRSLRRRRGSPPAHPDRQDGPGRPRSWPEGDRHRLRRPRLRRRHRRRCSRRPARRRSRRSTTMSTSSGVSLARRRPPDAGARAAQGELEARGPRRHHDRRRRRRPAAGLRGLARRGGPRDLPARHRDRRGCRPTSSSSCPAMLGYDLKAAE